MTEVERVLSELFAIRRRNRLSQKKVAERMGCAQSFVVMIERQRKGNNLVEKQRKDIQLSTLFRYAKAVGVRLSFAVDEPKDVMGTPNGESEGNGGSQT